MSLSALLFLGAYSAVVVFVEDLRGQGDAVAGLLLHRNILPHPHAVVLVAGDVQLGVVHFKSLEEADHILLLLLDLGGRRIDEINTDCTARGEKAAMLYKNISRNVVFWCFF